MKQISKALFWALFLLAGPAFAADTNNVIAGINAVATRVNAKLSQGLHNESDYADELKGFDSLYAKYKDLKTEESAQILLAKTQLYLEVLSDPLKASESLQQIKNDLPDTPTGKQVDGILASIAPAIEKEKIRLKLKPGTLFPDFNEKDLSGQQISVSQLKGKVVLIDFWATWCPPCRAELPNVIAIYQKYHAQGLEIIGVTLDDESARVEAFTKNAGMDWPEYFDGLAWDNKLVTKYGVDSIPMTYLVDKQGEIIGSALRGKDLENAVVQALAAK
jgi:thiol-disulfide isomerase/thioredoxin